MDHLKEPRRLKRSESFLGIHFDFHASEESIEVGKHTTAEMVENMLLAVKPDYIQIDCKGHRGFSSYPTEVGYQAPTIIGDPLIIWREATRKYGISLYMHYSGVWDTEAIRHHPTWARMDEKDEADLHNTSTFGPYVDQLLLPQLKELNDKYEVDGVWVDGECWATCQDYGVDVIKKFKEETGIEEVPRGPDDPFFYEFSEFCREGFRKYLRHYVDEMHKHNPQFEIASNWAFTSFMPEPVSANVDFISGDYSLQNSVNSARLEGRCMIKRGKPWDLMAWAFSCKFSEGDWCVSTKSIPQMKQEAAMVLSLGGGFQAYFQQKKKDGAISLWQMKLMSELAEFCRARQAFCHRAEPVPQIALLYSGASFYRQNTRLFSPWTGLLIPTQGILQSLLDSQQSVEILMEYQLQDKMKEYPLIIVPEWDYLEEAFKQQLLQYTEEGGNLLLIGPKVAAMFAQQLGVVLEHSEGLEPVRQWLEYGDWLAGHYTFAQSVTLTEKAKPIGKLYPDNDNTGEYKPAASITPYGKGKIAATYMNIGERYIHAATTVSREFLNGIVKELFPKPLVTVSGSHQVDVAVNRLNGKLSINLTNTSGPHDNPKVYVYDEIPAVGPLHMTIRTENEPSSVMLEPDGKKLDFEYKDGELSLTISRLEIHGVIVINEILT